MLVKKYKNKKIETTNNAPLRSPNVNQHALKVGLSDGAGRVPIVDVKGESRQVLFAVDAVVPHAHHKVVHPDLLPHHSSQQQSHNQSPIRTGARIESSASLRFIPIDIALCIIGLYFEIPYVI